MTAVDSQAVPRFTPPKISSDLQKWSRPSNSCILTTPIKLSTIVEVIMQMMSHFTLSQLKINRLVVHNQHIATLRESLVNVAQMAQ